MILRRILRILASGLLLAGLLLLIFPEPEGRRRQKTEEILAKTFLEQYSPEETAGSRSENVWKKEKKAEEYDGAEKRTEVIKPGVLRREEEAGNLPMIPDTVYYEREGVVFTPDYAVGRLLCVLQIPKKGVRICRGVYTGTFQEIRQDLDLWMVTAARPEYVLGKTHMVIYGHNHTVQNLSMNRLSRLTPGDEFILTDERKSYYYTVRRIYSLDRREVAELADDFTRSEKECYIITCGRGEYRYRDLVVEGILREESVPLEVR